MNWDQHYLDNQTPWDKGAPAPPLLEWLETNPDRINGSVLVPGSGMGHDVRAIARSCESVRVVGLDISPKAVELANQFSRVGQESYQEGDLFALDPSHHHAYDWIWEHTCFCAIDPGLRDAYVASVSRMLKPGGNLLGVFYLNPYDEEHSPGEGPPHGASIEELVSRFSETGEFTILENYVPQRSYPGREGLELVLRMRKNDA